MGKEGYQLPAIGYQLAAAAILQSGPEFAGNSLTGLVSMGGERVQVYGELRLRW
jgi:hypothetical protein